MLKNLQNFFLISIVLVLTNCSQPQFIAMPEEFKDNITTSEACYEKPQDKIYALVESTNISALHNSLLFSLVEGIADSVKKSDVDKSLEPIQAFYNQQSVELKLRTAIHSALQNTPWLHLTKLTVSESIESQNLEIVLKNTVSDVIVVIESDLKLNPRLDVMTGTLFLTIYPASTTLKAKLDVKTPKEALDKPIYKTKVMASYELPYFTEEIDQNAVKWTENNGRLFLEGLDKVIHSLGVQLESALKNPHTTME
jgi:hypothetical protein